LGEINEALEIPTAWGKFADILNYTSVNQEKRATKPNPSVLAAKHTPPTASGHADTSAEKEKPLRPVVTLGSF
jgi:hypothetical protein